MTDGAFDVLVSTAIEDLASRLECERGKISVSDVRSIVWPDASLGCPQPGMRYKQIQVEGAIVELAVSGDVFTYHCGGQRVVLCSPGM